MKDVNNLPTPQKEHLLSHSRNKSIADHARKPRKVPKKCLDAEFASVSENGSGETSSVSVICEDNQVSESVESSIQLAVNPDSSESTDLNLTLSSSTSIASNEAVCSATESDGSSLASLEAEIAVKHLTQARTLIVSASDGDPRVKKLLDSLITVVIEEFYGLPKERDLKRELALWRNRIMFVSFVLWMLLYLLQKSNALSMDLHLPDSENSPTRRFW